MKKKFETKLLGAKNTHIQQCISNNVAALRKQRNIERKENAKGRQWRNFPG